MEHHLCALGPRFQTCPFYPARATQKKDRGHLLTALELIIPVGWDLDLGY